MGRGGGGDLCLVSCSPNLVSKALSKLKCACCCGLGGSHSTEVISVIEEGQALPLQLPGDEASDVLTMRGHPSEDEEQTEVSEKPPFGLEAYQWPVGGVERKLPIGSGHVCQVQECTSTYPPDEGAYVMCLSADAFS